MKSVFFGPFIGELGWEMLFWQGWVRRMCLEDFRSFRKVAASFPGRQPFYPYVDEFWTLPDYFLQAQPSGHAYFTDGWRNGVPASQHPQIARVMMTMSQGQGIRRSAMHVVSRLVPRRVRQRLLQGRRSPRGGPDDPPDVEPLAEQMLAEFRLRLPMDAVCFVPWKKNYYAADALEFGVGVERTRDGFTYDIKAIPYESQRLEPLMPTPRGVDLCGALIPENRRLIGIFPRRRVLRRPDKNWPRDRYAHLIKHLQQAFPDLAVAIFGEPGGSYFVDGVPAGCLDLISIPYAHRLDVQIAALRQSMIAIGSISGALAVAMAAGCPALMWGYPRYRDVYERANFLRTRLAYLPNPAPRTEVVFRLARDMLS